MREALRTKYSRYSTITKPRVRPHPTTNMSSSLPATPHHFSNSKTPTRGLMESCRFPREERFIRSCPNRYLITLTTKRRLDNIQMSREVTKLFDRVNLALYGNHYRRKKRMMLATFAVQERSINQGLHTHLLIGVPEGSLSLKAHPCLMSVPDLIMSTWIKLDERGWRSANAQDARDIYDFDGARRYVMKTIRSAEFWDNVDVLNIIAPEI